jgi:hypothetical protein
MPRLCQVVALEAGIRNRTYSELTEHYKRLQKPALTSGLTRTYQPLIEYGDRFPDERTLVQIKAEDVIRQMTTSLARLFDITATRDYANCEARADVKVDGEILLAQVPVTYLLFLAKQVSDMRAVIMKLPVHDLADRWVRDESAGCWRTEPPVETYRTRKTPMNHVKAAATDRHPAQVDVYFEDKPVGVWTAVKFTGGIPEDRRAELLGRVDKLAQAVSDAREEANAREVDNQHTGEQVLNWLFA